ncbi:MAG: accessory factor UbiK family protein [Gammaproteobacteria bacterium]
MNTSTVNDLAKRLAAAVPDVSGSVNAMRDDLERNFRSLLDSAFERMELVTREEFDVQRKVLERTREKLTALEAKVAELEGTGDGPG